MLPFIFHQSDGWNSFLLIILISLLIYIVIVIFFGVERESVRDTHQSNAEYLINLYATRDKKSRARDSYSRILSPASRVKYASLSLYSTLGGPEGIDSAIPRCVGLACGSGVPRGASL